MDNSIYNGVKSGKVISITVGELSNSNNAKLNKSSYEYQKKKPKKKKKIADPSYVPLHMRLNVIMAKKQ